MCVCVWVEKQVKDTVLVIRDAPASTMFSSFIFTNAKEEARDSDSTELE